MDRNSEQLSAPRQSSGRAPKLNSVFAEFKEVFFLVISVDLVLEQVDFLVSFYGAVVGGSSAYKTLVISIISSAGSLLWDTFQSFRYRYYLKKKRDYWKKKSAWNIKQSIRVMHLTTVIAAGAGVCWLPITSGAGLGDMAREARYVREGSIVDLIAQYLNSLLAVAGAATDVLEWVFPLLFLPMLGDTVANCSKGLKSCWQRVAAIDVHKTAPFNLFLMCTYGLVVAWMDVYNHGAAYDINREMATIISCMLAVGFVFGWGAMCLGLRCMGPPPEKDAQSDDSSKADTQSGEPTENNTEGAGTTSEFKEVFLLVISVDLVLEQVDLLVSLYGAVVGGSSAYKTLVINTISSAGSLLWDSMQTLRYRFYLNKEREYRKKKTAWNIKQSVRIMHLTTVIAAGVGAIFMPLFGGRNLGTMAEEAKDVREGDQIDLIAQYLNGLLAVAGGSTDVLEWVLPLVLLPMLGDTVENCSKSCWDRMRRIDVYKTGPFCLFLMCTYGLVVAWMDVRRTRRGYEMNDELASYGYVDEEPASYGYGMDEELASIISYTLAVAFVLGWGVMYLFLWCVGPPPVKDKYSQSDSSAKNDTEGPAERAEREEF